MKYLGIGMKWGYHSVGYMVLNQESVCHRPLKMVGNSENHELCNFQAINMIKKSPINLIHLSLSLTMSVP